ncbi:hypothetical protein CDD82_6983 [Ophiocordyceps australis]|uniref:INO80 complex subunit F domain-containing protein n=1 Tax=Ophiocordyceps australis TaxID=1399860 RepID=A0A2C5ZM07_9HYPO|nr:hypothetical protein CDD82_6983 [Ophiocordyceps australis]
MSRKRFLSQIDSASPSAIPPALPPSVEEAYRRKCIQLKNRTNEVEEANDAARLRLARLKRQIEKLRIERAFLFEQLAKRTSTNVEDSEGSPSPPPTVRTPYLPPSSKSSTVALQPMHRGTFQPKDKPLRIKRGHRKSGVEGDAKTGSAGVSKEDVSPPSESQPHASESRSKQARNSAAALADSVAMASGQPLSAYELYCKGARRAMEAKAKEADTNVDDELARAWDELPQVDRDAFRAKFEAQSQKQRDETSSPKETDGAKRETKYKASSSKPEAQDDDVDMVNYDTEDQMDKDGDD